MMTPGNLGGHLLLLLGRTGREQFIPYVRALCLLAARHEEEFRQIADLLVRQSARTTESTHQ
jgi:hypothetical protein